MPTPRSSGSRRRVSAVALAVAIAATLSACGAPTPVPTASPSPTIEVRGDGVLTIGTLFPSTGRLAFLGAAQAAGVNAAVRAINAAGGVGGVPVTVVNRDSGDASSEKAEVSLAELVARGADVVIGPTSSTLAQRLLAPAAEAGVPLISPAASYPQLTPLDEQGIFFRTIASAPREGVALADALAADAVSSAVLVVADDPVSESLAVALEVALDERGIDVASVDGTAAPAEVRTAVDGSDADAVVTVLPDNGKPTVALLRALAASGGAERLWLTSGSIADYSQALPAGTLEGARGILDGITLGKELAAVIRREDPGLSSLRFAAEAYDATVLAALAAVVAGDDAGPSIGRNLVAVSIGGIKCTSFGECVDVLRSRDDIDYDGLSGSVNLDAAGDPERGTFTLAEFGPKNTAAVTGTVVG